MMKQAGAEKLRLAAGEPASATVDGRLQNVGERLSVTAITAVASEVMPAEELSLVGARRSRLVSHEHDGENFVIEVAREGAGVALVIRPAGHGSLRPRSAIAEVTLPKRRPRTHSRPPARSTTPSPPGVVSAAPLSIVPTPFTSLKPRPPSPKPMDELLREAVARGASDLHLSAGNHPAMRVNGEMLFLRHRPVVSSINILELVRELAPDRAAHEFAERSDTEFSYELRAGARFRVNLFEDRNGVCAVFRQIPVDILPADRLGLPQAAIDLCKLSSGLVLLCGPSGSGKSTTLAGLLDVINKTRADHIVTIESPIEFVHTNVKCLVNQREVGLHTKNFAAAFRAALREDPDVIVVGEMRDAEVIAMAMQAVDAGLLVFGTAQATDIATALDRLIDAFSPDRQAHARKVLAESLRGAIAQTLCKKIGGGRSVAYELLLATATVRAHITEGRWRDLEAAMRSSKALGMMTLNESLASLVQRKVIEPREALLHSPDRAGLATMLEAGTPPGS